MHLDLEAQSAEPTLPVSANVPAIPATKYYFVALEASPFILGTVGTLLWTVFDPTYSLTGTRSIWLILPTPIIVGLTAAYLIWHAQKCRWAWYPIESLARAVLDVIRSYASCLILGITFGAIGIRLLIDMVALVKPYDAKSKDPTADGTFKLACVFLVLAYVLLTLGLGILATKPLLADRRRLKEIIEEQKVNRDQERSIGA